MKYFFEEPDGRYTGSEDRILRTNSVRDNNDRCPIGRRGRMHDHYLKTTHPELYEPLILNGTFHKHLADANERAESILERLFESDKTAGVHGRTPESRTAHGVGRQKESYPKPGRGNRAEQSHP